MIANRTESEGPKLLQMPPDQGDSLVLHVKVGGKVVGRVECTWTGSAGTERWRVTKGEVSGWHQAQSFELVSGSGAPSLGETWQWDDPCLVSWDTSWSVPAGAALFRLDVPPKNTKLPLSVLWLALTPGTSGGAPRVDWYGPAEAVSGPYGYAMPSVAKFVRVSSTAGIARQAKLS